MKHTTIAVTATLLLAQAAIPGDNQGAAIKSITVSKKVYTGNCQAATWGVAYCEQERKFTELRPHNNAKDLPDCSQSVYWFTLYRDSQMVEKYERGKCTMSMEKLSRRVKRSWDYTMIMENIR
jgi:hypothetical protein